MAVLTVYPNYNGYVDQLVSGTGSGGVQAYDRNSTDEDMAISVVIESQPEDYVRRVFLDFDLTGAGLPGGATISEVKLWLYTDHQNNLAGNGYGIDIDGMVSHPVDVSDEDLWANIAGGTSYVTGDTTLQTVAQYNSVVLGSSANSEGASQGYLCIGIKLDPETLGPGTAAPSWLVFRSSNYTGTGSDPYLEVTYTAASARRRSWAS